MEQDLFEVDQVGVETTAGPLELAGLVYVHFAGQRSPIPGEYLVRRSLVRNVGNQ